MYRSILCLCAIVAATMFGSYAHADNYDLTLSGSVSDFHNGKGSVGIIAYDGYGLDLTGLNDANSITVNQGDTIDATVALDAPRTIPEGALFTVVALLLTGSDFPAGNTTVDSVFNFYDGGALVKTLSPAPSGTSDALISGAGVIPPGAFTFNSFTDDMTITELDAPATIDKAQFSYALASLSTSSAPEPTEWALMMLGVGGLGMALQRRKRDELAIVSA